MAKINESEIKNEIVLHEMGVGMYGVLRNGMPLLCPHIPHVMSRQKSIAAGGADVIIPQRSSCNSTCPLFKMDEAANKDSVMVEIGCSHVFYKIENILTIKEQSENNKTDEISMKLV